MSIDISAFREIGEKYLQTLIETQTQESLTLDFKTASDDQQPLFSDSNLTKHGRKVLAKALSAFSNSAGGQIVIGVDCRKNEDGIDCAQDLVPIAQIERVKTAVSSSVGDLLQPKHAEIDVISCRSDTDPSAGYLLIDVPRSERRPHRAEASGLKQYFKRSGSASYEMEHFDIEDAFRRKAAPDLDVELFLRQAMQSGYDVTLNFEFHLKNISENIAEIPFLKLLSNKSMPLQAGHKFTGASGIEGVRLERHRGFTKAYANNDFIIYPSDSRKFLTMRLELIGVSDGKIEKIEGANGSFFNLDFELEVGARNMRMKKVIIPFHDIYMEDRPWRDDKPFKSA